MEKCANLKLSKIFEYGLILGAHWSSRFKEYIELNI
jgi:hypothetical protein